MLQYLWGKYSVERYHPLIYHMIDTASVAEVLIDLYEKQFQIKTEQLIFLIALHDFGKATPGFQAKVTPMQEKLEKEGFLFPASANANHSKLGQWFLPLCLEKQFHIDEEVASEWSMLVTSHHGRVLDLFTDEPQNDGEKWQGAREMLFDSLHGLYDVAQWPDEPPVSGDGLFIMGLCSVSDWIASNEYYFPYASEFYGDVNDYRRKSLELAKKAVSEIGFHKPFVNHKTFHTLFPFSPNALQQAAMEHTTQHEKETMLMIVEAPMGEGKTEAALGAFAKRASIEGQKGLFFALPTQATSNMIFSRLQSFIENFVEDQAQLHLLHADAMLNEEYRRLKIRSINASEENAVKASEWFVARKRALLADFGVGTVDQAELAVLRVKHFFVRLFALADKMVIVDEVHAYDAYMSGVLEVLLGWLRELNTSVILLSATLPKSKRRQLIEAFSPDGKVDELAKYPAIHSISSKGVLSSSVEGLREFTGVITPLPCDDWIECVADLLDEKLLTGGCAACVVNTVSDAQKLYQKLVNCFPNDQIELFHARVTKKDRTHIENRIIEKFGTHGKRPQRAIVVATQVIEQSLDVDFDLMVTQPAPIDLMLQRMGRLHRHKRNRPEKLGKRELFVTVPKQLERNKEIFGKSRFVYYPDILYKSIAFLYEEDRWQSIEVDFPTGLSTLVEKVYDDTLGHNALENWENEREGEEYAHYYLSQAATIPEADESLESLVGLDNGFEDDTDAPNAKTRLGEESVTLVLVRDECEMSIENFSDIRHLYESSIKVTIRWLRSYFAKVDTPTDWSKTPMLRYAKPMLYDTIIEEGSYMARYDQKLGLIIEKRGEDV